MTTLPVVVALLLSVVSCEGKNIPSFAGPYLMHLDKFSACSDNDPVWRDFYGSMRISHFNPRRPNDPQILNGTMHIPMDVDDSFRFSALVHKRANNQWKRNYFVLSNFPLGACSALRHHFPSALQAAYHIKPTGRCLVTKGTYTFNNLPVVWEFANFPVLPYGYYFIQIKGERNEGQRNSSFIRMCGEGGVIPKPM